MKRDMHLAIVGLLAVGVMGFAAATMFSAGQATRSFGDLSADWAAVTPAPYSPPQGTDVYWENADLSNSGEFVAYERQKDRFVRAIQIARVPGGQVRVDSLLPLEAFPNAGTPRFSLDGKRIVFCAAREDEPPQTATVSPWVVNPDGTGLSRLRDDGHDYASPAWRPDGKQVAFRRSPLDSSAEEIVFLDPDTGETLSTLQHRLLSFRFSPDGEWLLGRKVVPPNMERLIALNLRTGEERVVWDPTPLGQPESDYAWWIVNYAWAFDSRRVFFTAFHRDWELAQGPSASEIWQGSLDGPASKIMDGQVLAGSLNGKYILIDKRRVPSREELRPGDVQLLTLKAR